MDEKQVPLNDQAMEQTMDASCILLETSLCTITIPDTDSEEVTPEKNQDDGIEDSEAIIESNKQLSNGKGKTCEKSIPAENETSEQQSPPTSPDGHEVSMLFKVVNTAVSAFLLLKITYIFFLECKHYRFE